MEMKTAGLMVARAGTFVIRLGRLDYCFIEADVIACFCGSSTPLHDQIDSCFQGHSL